MRLSGRSRHADRPDRGLLSHFARPGVLPQRKQLFLLDKRAELAGLGLWGLRLLFTGEGPEEVDAVVDAWNCGGGFDGTRHTRGLYYRGVE